MADRDPKSEPFSGAVVAFEGGSLLRLDAVLAYFSAVAWIDRPPRVLILDLTRVPAIDPHGATTIRILSRLCRERHVLLLLTALWPDAYVALARAGLIDDIGCANVSADWAATVIRAERFIGSGGSVG